jgi:hypothetical protein
VPEDDVLADTGASGGCRIHLKQFREFLGKNFEKREFCLKKVADESSISFAAHKKKVAIQVQKLDSRESYCRRLMIQYATFLENLQKKRQEFEKKEILAPIRAPSAPSKEKTPRHSSSSIDSRRLNSKRLKAQGESELVDFIGYIRNNYDAPLHHYTEQIMPKQFKESFENLGSPEEILRRTKYTRAVLQLPVYELICEWSEKFGGCISMNNSLIGELRRRGSWHTKESLRNALKALEKSRLIFRTMQPLGPGNGSVRLIIPLHRAHRGIATLVNIGKELAAALTISTFLNVSIERARSSIFKEKARRRGEKEAYKLNTAKTAVPTDSPPSNLFRQKSTYVSRWERLKLARKALALEGPFPTGRQGIEFYLHRLEEKGTQRALNLLGKGSEEHLDFFRYVIRRTFTQDMREVTHSLALWLDRVWNRCEGNKDLIFVAGKHDRRGVHRATVDDSIGEGFEALRHLCSRHRKIQVEIRGNDVLFQAHPWDKERLKGHIWDQEAKIKRILKMNRCSMLSFETDTMKFVQEYGCEKFQAIWRKYLTTRDKRVVYE